MNYMVYSFIKDPVLLGKFYNFSGHYYSYIKKGNKWMCMNDEMTQVVNEQVVQK